MLALSATQSAHMCAVSNHDCNSNETLACMGLLVIGMLVQGHLYVSIMQAAEANAISCVGGLAFWGMHTS